MPNPVLRFLLIRDAVLIVSMWIRLYLLFLRLPRCRRRRVARWHFQA
jgi:hypothetical protein